MDGQERRDTEAEENELLEDYISRSAVGFKNADVWRERRAVVVADKSNGV